MALQFYETGLVDPKLWPFGDDLRERFELTRVCVSMLAFVVCCAKAAILCMCRMSFSWDCKTCLGQEQSKFLSNKSHAVTWSCDNHLGWQEPAEASAEPLLLCTWYCLC